MLAFISGNLGTIVVGVIVLAGVFVAVMKTARGSHCDKCGICENHATDNIYKGKRE
jgi:hypothetical protein